MTFDVREVQHSAEEIRAGTSIMKFSLGVIVTIAIALIGAGIALVYLGATGDSQMSVFGASLKTTSVGVVGIFAGLVLGVLGIRRVLTALERLGRM